MELSHHSFCSDISLLSPLSSLLVCLFPLFLSSLFNRALLISTSVKTHIFTIAHRAMLDSFDENLQRLGARYVHQALVPLIEAYLLQRKIGDEKSVEGRESSSSPSQSSSESLLTLTLSSDPAHSRDTSTSYSETTSFSTQRVRLKSKLFYSFLNDPIF